MLKHIVICLLSMSISQLVICQNKNGCEKYFTEGNGGLCNETLYLCNDKTFYSESGCEASSHLCFGSWKMNRDTIIFHPFTNKYFKVVKTITGTKTESRKLEVTVFDNQGINISNRVVVSQLVKGKGIYSMDIDTAGKSWTDIRRDSAVIILQSLRRVFNQPLEINVDTLNNLALTLDLKGYWLFNTHADQGKGSDFKLIKGKYKLVSVHPDKIGENGQLVKTEYTWRYN